MLKDDIKGFFNVVENNSTLSSNLNNKYIQLYLKVVGDKFLNFPRINLSNIVCFGYPNNEYLEKRFNSFNKLISEIKSNSLKPHETENLIKKFLTQCHSDDETQENEFKIYYYIFNKSEIISKKEIAKISTFETKSKLTFPCKFTIIPYGTFVNISKVGENYLISNSLNIDLTWLKIKTKKNFKAKLLIGVKWFKDDYNFFNNKKSKWINSLVFGFRKEQSIVYILKINDTDIIKDFEKNGIQTEMLDTCEIDSESHLIKRYNKVKKLGYRGLVCKNHICTEETFDVNDYEIHRG